MIDHHEIVTGVAGPGDEAVLAEFNRAMARETEGIDLDPDTVLAGVGAIIAHPDRGFYVVARRSGQPAIAGALMVTYEWSDWRNGHFWWIQSVYVHPDERRRGIYRTLYATVRERARLAGGVCGFRLYVERDNTRAQATYESLGMSPTAYLLYESGPPDAHPKPRSR